MRNTRDAILQKALSLFSERGFKGVSMRDIAGAAGIRAASLYNHFRSKEDIFNSIIEEMSKRYEEAAAKMQIPCGSPEDAAGQYMKTSVETLAAIAKNIFLYFLKDDFASRFRRMLTIEQFGSTLASDAFRNFFIEGALNFQGALFKHMMKMDGFIECDPYIMALHFYSPVFLLLSKYDRDPGKEEEMLDILEKHVMQFDRIYRRTGGINCSNKTADVREMPANSGLPTRRGSATAGTADMPAAFTAVNSK